MINPTTSEGDRVSAVQRKLNIEWWSVKKHSYPFHAEAPISIRPDWVDKALGEEIASTSIRIGWRVYGFKTAAARDRFCTLFGGRVIDEPSS